MSQNNRIEKIDSYVKNLSKTKDKWVSLAIAVDIADEIMKGILPNINNWHNILNRNSQENFVLPNPLALDTFKTQKQQSWFEQHPVLTSARVALNHFSEKDCPLESRLFWFSDKETKQKISVTTQFFDNWEDSDLTKKENYKVGIDFFLSADTNKFIMVLTNNQKLRVMEFADQLSNTQKQILSEKLFNLPYREKMKSDILPQELIHKHLWDSFHLKEVNNKFYQGISRLHNKLVDYLVERNSIEVNDARQFSSRILGRLLFIWFLRKMDLINEDVGYFDIQQSDASTYYEENLKRLFFHTLNKPMKDRDINALPFDGRTPYLNGGLFDIKENDFYDRELKFPDDYFKELYNHFNEFNFTIDESSVDYQFVAVDPEMLGQIFESLLADQNNKDDTSERNKTGSFYTPRNIVEYMCKEAIRQYLYRKIDNDNFNAGIDHLIDWTDSEFMKNKSSSTMDLWGTNTDIVKTQVLKALNSVKIIDPAVGSGAFPIGIMQLMSKLYERLHTSKEYDAYTVKLNIIANNIYGVDIQPMAIEIARLRAWLALIVEDQDHKNVHTLPNLEFKFISANSLESLDDSLDGGKQITIGADPLFQEHLTEIRIKYFAEADPERKNLLQDKYYKLTNKSGFYDIRRTTQLKSFDPFTNTKSASFFDSEFMFGIKDGFDIVIGNPPYIHFQKMEKPERDYFSRLPYKTFAARGDIYTLFYEHGLNILKSKGVLVYITSNKWMRAAYGNNLRNFFIQESNPLALVDLGEGVFEHATVDTNILVLAKENNKNKITTLALEDENLDRKTFDNAVNMSYKTNEMWVILNPIERSIKNKLEAVGVPLNEWDISINRGILTGLNEAFIIDENKKNELIQEDPKSIEIIKPILRGRDISKGRYKFANIYLITTYPALNININSYPAIKNWLINGNWVKIRTKKNPPTPIGSGKLRLEQSGKSQYFNGVKFNSRKKTNNKWFEIQDTISYWEDFGKEKIVFARIAGNQPKFSLDNCGFLVNDTGYIIVGKEINYLVEQLLSDTIWFALNLFYMGGGIDQEFKVANLKRLPIPKVNTNLDLSKEEITYIDNYLKSN